MSVYANFGVGLPHSSAAMRSVGYGVSTSDMQAGDIVCYSGHVGIYAGNGTIVNASNPSSGITYTNVGYRNILAVRRIF
jgi:cell wall-associated NlpC family hydrolase